MSSSGLATLNSFDFPIISLVALDLPSTVCAICKQAPSMDTKANIWHDTNKYFQDDVGYAQDVHRS